MNLTLQKLPFECQKIAKKLAILKKNMPKIVVFFQKIANGNFLEKMTIFGNFFFKCKVFGQFFDSQMAIFRRVRSQCKNNSLGDV